jgi:hypothetical protein
MPTPRVPAREWLAVVLPPAFALIVLSAAGVDSSRAHGWLAFGCAVAGGLVPPLVYTVVLAKEGRLFLRDMEEIRHSRARITAVAIPAGWALGAALTVVAVLFGGLSKVTLLAVLGGAMLGFWPGLLANFMRLRLEEWTG